MENRYMNATEASNYLGISITEIYQRSSRNELPSYKFGGRLLYRKDELEKLIFVEEDDFEDQDFGQAA